MSSEAGAAAPDLRLHPLSWLFTLLTQLLTGHPAIDEVIPFARKDGWRGFAAGPWQERIDVRDFIQRNYEHDAQGQWFFQNGPQRVYVELQATPWIFRVAGAGHRAVAEALADGPREVAIVVPDIASRFSLMPVR